MNATGTYTYNGQSATGTATGQVKYDNAPYVSIGWGNHAPSKGGFFFNSELGAMLTGKPSVTLSESTGKITQDNLDVERNKVRDNALGWFPIVKLGVGYSL